MNIDLQRDYELVLSFIKRRVEDYAQAPNHGPGDPSAPVTFIELAYSYEQGGWIGLVFDTRPNAQPDGEYTLFLNDESNLYYMPDTSEALNANLDQGKAVDVILTDGTVLVINEDGELCLKDESESEYEGDFNECVGDMMRKAMEHSRRSRLFEQLPLGSPCYIGVEESSGCYAWPAYENYKTEGKIN